jgi:hypothetical protein
MGVDENLPTIAIVAHYDTFGVAPVSKLPLIYLTAKLLSESK